MVGGELGVEDCWLEDKAFHDETEGCPSKRYFVGEIEPDLTVDDEPAVAKPLGEPPVGAVDIAAGVSDGVANGITDDLLPNHSGSVSIWI